MRAIERAEIASRHLTQLVGDPGDEIRALAYRACFVLALEPYRSRGVLGRPGDEFEALLRVTLQGVGRELNLRFAVVRDWLQERGLELDGRREELDLFAWHLGRIRLADEITVAGWVLPACGYIAGPLDGALRFFARIDKAKSGRASE